MFQKWSAKVVKILVKTNLRRIYLDYEGVWGGNGCTVPKNGINPAVCKGLNTLRAAMRRMAARINNFSDQFNPFYSDPTGCCHQDSLIYSMITFLVAMLSLPSS